MFQRLALSPLSGLILMVESEQVSKTKVCNSTLMWLIDHEDISPLTTTAYRKQFVYETSN
jgi:hypothetical protein